MPQSSSGKDKPKGDSIFLASSWLMNLGQTQVEYISALKRGWLKDQHRTKSLARFLRKKCLCLWVDFWSMASPRDTENGNSHFASRSMLTHREDHPRVLGPRRTYARSRWFSNLQLQASTHKAQRENAAKTLKETHGQVRRKKCLLKFLRLSKLPRHMACVDIKLFQIRHWIPPGIRHWAEGRRVQRLKAEGRRAQRLRAEGRRAQRLRTKTTYISCGCNWVGPSG